MTGQVGGARNELMHAKITPTKSFVLAALLLVGACSKSGNSSAPNDSSTTTASTSCTSGNPSISINPTSGPVGTLVTITGTGFDLSTLSSATINGTSTIIVSSATCSARILVMPGTTSGTLTATTGSGNQTTSTSFSITAGAPIATQQGLKLVGTGDTGQARQGYSVALSADGNTAIVGGYTDDSNQGAAWVFIRNGLVWTQQGSKLVGTGNVGAAQQGYSVSLSADGNTAIVGGIGDNASVGAAWIYVRSGTTWAQQGSKLVGTGGVGVAQQGYRVALSADGSTALVGGIGDNTDQGAAWVFVRAGTAWSQQGTKLVGTGNVGQARQGYGVALSADGNTALVAGYTDNTNQGAVWVFVRSGSTWSQQGAKLVGTGNTGTANQGFSVALSAEGNTAIVGGYRDNAFQGAAWVFTRSGTTWSQQGTKLVGTGNTGTANQGYGVALSADGNTALIGGFNDNTSQGAVWVFVRTGTTWSQQGAKLVGTGNIGAAMQGWKVALSADGATALVGGIGDNTNQGATWVFVP